MQELPSGTVTFLFTDIAGSTRLLHELGDGYAEALAEHRRVLRAAFARHGGVEVDTQGDAFFVAFGRASDALAAAREVQSALDGPVRVRMGVHTGEPLLTDEGYVGIDVHRAARIAAAGHGGQILVSQSTRELVGAEGLRDLGEHRLKDLIAPERIYQLGDGDFPALKTLNRTNLPVAAAPLVGRARELRELGELLRDSVRAVTITGAGGTGKTRLALQVAAELVDDYEDGVFFVPLAPLRDPTLVIPAISEAMGAKGDLGEQLSQSRALVVLDNFEHLLDAAPHVAAVLAAAPGLRVLATSRAPLHIATEHEYPLDPLSDEDAVAFFLARARATGRRVEAGDAVTRICRRLDNLPLAIELAVGRLKLLEPTELLERIDRALPLLTGGARDAPARQRTLRATIRWSYDLLRPEARELFARLSVFAGPFSVASAENVCDADLDGLESLLDLSLLKGMGDSRLLMLETIREFAQEQLLECGDEERLAHRHAEHYHERAESLRMFQSAALQRSFEHDEGNFRVALEHLITFGPAEHALEMADSLCNYWVWRGQLDEGERWTERALAAVGATPHGRRAWAIGSLGEFARFRGDDARAICLKEEALALARENGDVSLEAATLHDLADTHAHAGDYGRARERATEALEIRRRVGKPMGIAHALSSFIDIEMFEGHYEEALRVAHEVACIYREHEPGTIEHSLALFMVSEAHRRRGEAAEAVEALRESLAIAGELHQRFYLYEILFSTAALVATADAHRAGVLIGAAETIRAESGLYVWDSSECERIASAVRERLGEPAFEIASAEGSALDGDRAVAAALESLTMLQPDA